jgi:hypothetical protein
MQEEGEGGTEMDVRAEDGEDEDGVDDQKSSFVRGDVKTCIQKRPERFQN